MPIGHVVLKIYVPWKSFHVPSQYLYKPCKAYVYCRTNKYMPILKNHMPCQACNHKSLCALGQDLHAPGMRACLNVESCFSLRLVSTRLLVVYETWPPTWLVLPAVWVIGPHTHCGTPQMYWIKSKLQCIMWSGEMVEISTIFTKATHHGQSSWTALTACH